MGLSSDQQGPWPGTDTAAAELGKDTVIVQADTEDPGMVLNRTADPTGRGYGMKTQMTVFHRLVEQHFASPQK